VIGHRIWNMSSKFDKHYQPYTSQYTPIQNLKYKLHNQYIISWITNNTAIQYNANTVWQVYSVIQTFPHCLSHQRPTVHRGTTVPSSTEEILQDKSVQRLKGGNPITGLPSGRLVTRPREISITIKSQCKENRTQNITCILTRIFDMLFCKTLLENF
jgi:hypothetical protein